VLKHTSLNYSVLELHATTNISRVLKINRNTRHQRLRWITVVLILLLNCGFARNKKRITNANYPTWVGLQLLSPRNIRDTLLRCIYILHTMTYDYCDTIASQVQLGSDAQILKTNDMK